MDTLHLPPAYVFKIGTNGDLLRFMVEQDDPTFLFADTIPYTNVTHAVTVLPVDHFS